MTADRNRDYLVGLVRELCNLPHETEWVEFKVNHRNPQSIGEYVSALSNAAALHDKVHAYILWGIENGTHAVVGTDFSPGIAKKGNEPLETWLLRLLKPRIDFRFQEIEVDVNRVVLMEIDRASQHPVAFEGVEYIRVGSSKRKLKDYQEKERALWRVFDRVSFEDGIAAERVLGEDVLLKLDYPAYFDLLEMPLPDGREAILHALQSDRLISSGRAGGFDITNLGAILFARNLADFPHLKRKAARVVQYRGKGRTETVLLRQRHGADDGDLRRPHRDHEPGRAARRYPTLPRHPAPVPERGAGLADAPGSHLRGTRRRHRQGSRFGIKENNKAVASRRIREAVDAGVIKPLDEGAGRRFMKYLPFWA